MATQFTICNAALAMLGSNRVTSAEFDAGLLPRVIEVKEQFWFALDELLRQHHWRWAKARISLEEVDAPAFGWTHAFELPEGFISMITLNEVDAYNRTEYFEIEGNAVLTDATEADIVYIRRPDTDEIDEFLEFVDPLAVTAFITLLASKVATKETEGQEKTNQLLNRFYSHELPRARTRAANEVFRPRRTTDSDLLWSRYRSTNG